MSIASVNVWAPIRSGPKWYTKIPSTHMYTYIYYNIFELRYTYTYMSIYIACLLLLASLFFSNKSWKRSSKLNSFPSGIMWNPLWWGVDLWSHRRGPLCHHVTSANDGGNPPQILMNLGAERWWFHCKGLIIEGYNSQVERYLPRVRHDFSPKTNIC